MNVENYLSNFHVSKPDPQFHPSRVICLPVDESVYSQHTISWAIKYLLQPTDLILLLHVRPASQYHPEVLSVNYHDAFQQVTDQQRQISQELLQEFVKKLKDFQVEAIGLVGDPRHALIEKIEQVKPTIVVVGQRGMGALGRIVIGSVSDHLVHHSHSPVLVVTK